MTEKPASPDKRPGWPQDKTEEAKAMTRRSGYFCFESIVVVAVAVLALMTFGLFAQAVLNPLVLA